MLAELFYSLLIGIRCFVFCNDCAVMGFIPEFACVFVELVTRNLSFLFQSNVACLFVAQFSRREVFRKKIDSRVQIPWSSRLVVRFLHFVPLFIALDIVDAGINKIARNRRLSYFLIVKVNDGS